MATTIIKGTVKEVLPIETVGSNNTQKQIVLVNSGDQYNPVNAVTFLKEKTEQSSALNTGDTVEMNCNVNQREWQGKYFTDVAFWKMEAPVVKAPVQEALTSPF